MKIDLLNNKCFTGGQPHDQFDWLRENSPIHWQELPNGEGLWLLTRFQDIYEVNRNFERFTSTKGVIYPCEMKERFGWQKDQEAEHNFRMMLEMDPPLHTDYRKLIRKELSKRAAEDYIPRTKEFAKMIIDDVIDSGHCNFVRDVAGKMAGLVIADLMGLPLKDSLKLYEFTELFHSPVGYLDKETQEERLQAFGDYVGAIADEKRANPGNDLTSKLLLSEISNTPINFEDFALQFLLMINGGTDTARNIIAVGLTELLDHPKQHQWLMEDLDNRIPLAREEMLRWISPVVYQCRTATEDTILGNQKIKKGDILAMYFGAANRDPEKFSNPHTFDVSRTANSHIAFGGGHHICLGQWLARAEIDAMLYEVLKRLHNIKILGEVKWLQSNFVFGLAEMNITFDPQLASP